MSSGAVAEFGSAVPKRIEKPLPNLRPLKTCATLVSFVRSDSENFGHRGIHISGEFSLAWAENCAHGWDYAAEACRQRRECVQVIIPAHHGFVAVAQRLRALRVIIGFPIVV